MPSCVWRSAEAILQSSGLGEGEEQTFSEVAWRRALGGGIGAEPAPLPPRSAADEALNQCWGFKSVPRLWERGGGWGRGGGVLFGFCFYRNAPGIPVVQCSALIAECCCSACSDGGAGAESISLQRPPPPKKEPQSCYRAGRWMQGHVPPG